MALEGLATTRKNKSPRELGDRSCDLLSYAVDLNKSDQMLKHASQCFVPDVGPVCGASLIVTDGDFFIAGIVPAGAEG